MVLAGSPDWAAKEDFLSKIKLTQNAAANIFMSDMEFSNEKLLIIN